MHNISLIEESYKKFIKNLTNWIPEGIFFLNLELLHRFDLLHFQPIQERKESSVPQSFHVIESPEKITLINDEFIVWIIPDTQGSFLNTYTLIARNYMDKEPQLEVAFIATGIYNTTKLVLKVLEKFLVEIKETDQILSHFQEIE